MKKLFTVLFAITTFALVANEPAPAEKAAVVDEMAETTGAEAPVAETTTKDTSIDTAAGATKMSYKDARKACQKENKGNKKAIKDCIKGKRS